MPAALQIDKEQVRIVAVTVGVREAARQFQLPEGTVRAWSCREGWLVEKGQEESVQEQAVARVRERQGLQPVAASASDILKNYAGETRLHLAKGLHAGAKAVSEMDGQEVLMASQNIASLTKSAAVVHGWASGDNNVTVRLDMVAQMPNPPVIDIHEPL